MALEALKHYSEHAGELDPDITPARGQVSAFMTRRFQVVTTPRQSAELVGSRIPSIVISSSGMATGGRVLSHLKAALPNARNTVLFSGFQAAGTRGRKLLEGEREIKIHGEMVPVNAQIAQLHSMSAHADSDELMRWLKGFKRPAAPDVCRPRRARGVRRVRRPNPPGAAVDSRRAGVPAGGGTAVTCSRQPGAPWLAEARRAKAAEP